jgi:hypothetical protein
MEMTFMAPLSPKFPFKGARSGNEVSDWLATEIFARKTKKTRI